MITRTSHLLMDKRRLLFQIEPTIDTQTDRQAEKKVKEYEEKSFARRSLVFISTGRAAKFEPGARKMSATLKTRERRANGLLTASKVFERDCRKHLSKKPLWQQKQQRTGDATKRAFTNNASTVHVDYNSWYISLPSLQNNNMK